MERQRLYGALIAVATCLLAGFLYRSGSGHLLIVGLVSLAGLGLLAVTPCHAVGQRHRRFLVLMFAIHSAMMLVSLVYTFKAASGSIELFASLALLAAASAALTHSASKRLRFRRHAVESFGGYHQN